MLLVIASRRDEMARALVARWGRHDARLLASEDLSATGWRYDPEAPERSIAVVGGRRVSCREIRGVFTRLACVGEWDLPHIVSADRSYVAAEMTAFLMAWLSALTCPVVNRPRPLCLSGPNWSTELWTRAAFRLGIPVRPVARHVTPRQTKTPPADGPASVTTVTVAGSRCFGTDNEVLRDQSRRLAKAADVSLLGVRFAERAGQYVFLGADLWPNPCAADVADAVLEQLLGENGG